MSDVLDRLTRSLEDRYLVKRELGAGGWATVYLATDLKHQRQVAIKVMRPEVASAIGLERFVQCSRIGAARPLDLHGQRPMRRTEIILR